MDEEDYNFCILHKIEKEVSIPVLRDLFETLWETKYPETPWTKNAASVKEFEQKEDELFEKGLQGLSQYQKKRKRRKRTQRQSTFRDSYWTNYDWDISKLVHALVDSKLFDLSVADEDGVPVSYHIVNIRTIRNEIAHPNISAFNTEYFKRTFKSLSINIKSLQLLIDVSQYTDKLLTIHSQTPHVSKEEVAKLKQECENLKKQQIHKEIDFRHKLLKQKVPESEKILQAKLKKIKDKKEFLIKQYKEKIKSKHSKENEGLKSENTRLKYELWEYNKKFSKECKKLQSDFEHMQEVTNDFKKRHSVELETVQKENNYLKAILKSTRQMHGEEIRNLQSQISLLKQNVEDNCLQANNGPEPVLRDTNVTIYHPLVWYLVCALVLFMFLPMAGSQETRRSLTLG